MTTLPDNATGYCACHDPSLWMQRQMTTPTPVSRGEFGAIAVPRILKIVARRDIPSTFFVPGHTIDTYPDVCRRIVDAGAEIGLHGYAHELNATVRPEKERWAFTRSMELVDELTGAAPAGYRAPSGDLTEQTIRSLFELGIRYDSSLMAMTTARTGSGSVTSCPRTARRDGGRRRP